MQSLLNSVVIYNGYPLSFVVALTFHGLLLALLVYFQGIDRTDTLVLVQPTVIKALFIDENPQVRNERQRLERREQQQLASERQREEAARQAEAERLQQERNQAQERQQEQERSALLERQERDRLRDERAEQLERERQQQEADQRRQRELAEAESQAQERERLRQQAASEAVALQATRTEYELVQSGTALIQQIVQENWSRPPSARNGMRAVIQIRMLPTGELVNATITQSSGDAAFDRSAENAVYRAAPFRELQTLPINVFNANFRVLSLIFQPEDLLN